MKENNLPIRPEKIQCYTTVAADMKDVPFGLFVDASDLYAQYLCTHDRDYLRKMGYELYTCRSAHLQLTYNQHQEQIKAMATWWRTLQQYLARKFPHLFKHYDEFIHAQAGGQYDFSGMVHTLIGKQWYKLAVLRWRDTHEVLGRLDRLAEKRQKHRPA